MTRNVLYSDGTMVDGEGKGTILDGTPGKDAYYTGYHWTKAMCETCGTLNSNGGFGGYSFNKNVYNLYDCAAECTEHLPESVTYEYTDSTYHTKTTAGGSYCCFCYGTNRQTSSTLERHTLETDILPQPANGRFAEVEHCTLCDYSRYAYTTAKAVIADYYGAADGQPHTISVTDLSESGVRTSIRYGNSADACTLTSAPNYTEAGQYTVYYAITYTYGGESMTENGVANVWLRDESTSEDGSCGCGCGDPNCGCQDQNCGGNCCKGNACGDNHRFVLLDSVSPSCQALGYDRYLCTECGKIEKRDYTAALEHSWQGVVVREATCEADGKLLNLCARCGQMEVTATPKGEHVYHAYPVAATCTHSGYTVRECEVCGDRHIEDITPALAHSYESHTTPAACEAGGHTSHICHGCGSGFITDYTDALGHSWDKGTAVTGSTCTGEGMTEYRCVRCANSIMGSIFYDACAKTGRRPCKLCKPSALELVKIPEKIFAPVKPSCGPFQKNLPNPELRAIQRLKQSQEERRNAPLDSMTGQERADLLTLTQPGYAFWAAAGYQTFHQRDCRKLKGLSNLKGFSRFRDATCAGYTPCKLCKPTKKQDMIYSIPITSQKRQDESVQDLAALCEESQFIYSREADYFIIRTPFGRWRIHLKCNPIAVDHINLTTTPDNPLLYHRQPRLFLSLTDTFAYIKRHDRKLLDLKRQPLEAT